MSNSSWLGVPAAAKELGVVSRTIYRLIDQGGIPAYRFGRVIRIRRVDLDRYLDAHRIATGALGHLYPKKT